MPQTPRVAVAIAATDQYSAEFIRFRQQIMGVGKELRKLDLPGTRLPSPTSGGLLGQIRQQVAAARSQATGGALSFAQAIPGIGGLGALGTVGGIGAAVVSYAQFGVTLENASKQAGTTAAGLNSLRGAARMAGLDAGTADTAMVGLNSTIRDAVYGRNGTAANYFHHMGIDIGNIRDGAKPAGEALRAVANVLKPMYDRDPNAAIRLGSIFGLDAQGLALLARGSDELDRLRGKAAALSPVTEEGQRNAAKYAENIGALTTAAEGWRNSLVNGVAPALLSVFGYLERETPAAQKRMSDFGTEITGVFDDIRKLGHELGADQVPGWIKRQFDGSNPITTPGGLGIGTGLPSREGGRPGGRDPSSPYLPGGVPSWDPLQRRGGPPVPGAAAPGSGATNSELTPSADKAAFIAKWGPEARRIAGDLRTSPENILAHWGQETGWGRHEHDNNVGNLQALSGTPGTVVRGDTHGGGSAYRAPFFTYRTPAEAADAYKSWIIRHGAPVQGTENDPVAFGEALRSRGYMENRGAPGAIARERQGLVIPDTPPAALTAAAEPEPVKPDLTRGGRIPADQAPTMGGTATLRIVHENKPGDVSTHLDTSDLEGVFASIHTEHAMPPGVLNPNGRAY